MTQQQPTKQQPDTIKLLEENTGQTLSDINDSNIFSDPPLRVMTVKTKINKWDLIKLKSFCTAKETLNKMKRQATEWEKIFASHGFLCIDAQEWDCWIKW